jgi:DNA-binding NtrC family response regulator
MSNARILVADDKENILKLFEKILADSFDVATVGDGNRALAMVLNGDFDVVVSDTECQARMGLRCYGRSSTPVPRWRSS